MNLPPTHLVFIDETGDRGTRATSSRFFALAAVVVATASLGRLEESHASLCAQVGRRPDHVLHWRDNLTRHGQRHCATTVLGSAPVRTSFVVVDKAALPEDQYLRSDPVAMYNYPVRFLLERVSWLVRDAGGITRVVFGAVKDFPRARFDEYIEKLRSQHTQIHWKALLPKFDVRSPADSIGIQLADIAAGALDAAIRPDAGHCEPGYLLNLAPTIYRRGPASIGSYGLKVIGANSGIKAADWWAELERDVPRG